jgi:transcriptional regulator with XRE-family HTH domain
MPKATVPTFPSVQRQLAELGLRLRLARKRRRLGTELFSERMGVSRETLRRLEKGDASIAIGTFMRALRVLGLERDVDHLALDDELGRKLQDLELLGSRQKVRSTIRKTDVK